MRLLVHLLEIIRADVVLDELGELLLVAVLVVLLEHLHVLLHVSAEDVLAVGLRVEVLLLGVVAREALLAVGDVEAAINRALEGAKHTIARGGAHEADIKHARERARTIIVLLHLVHLAIGLGLTLVRLVKAKLLEGAARKQQTSRVACGIVGETHLDAVARKLVRVGSGHNHVTLDLRVDDLADNVLVGDAHDHAVLGCRILVLVLNRQALAGKVVRLALAPPAVLDLEGLEVLRRLLHLHETHGCSTHALRCQSRVRCLCEGDRFASGVGRMEL
mmetsp:Transcript_10798/g.26194  ORF Transcript_10798/g.26194 Transcript_10798/m.26194 type:complete len:276 (+) Transcript_10798:683-1510(+)